MDVLNASCMDVLNVFLCFSSRSRVSRTIFFLYYLNDLIVNMIDLNSVCDELKYDRYIKVHFIIAKTACIFIRIDQYVWQANNTWSSYWNRTYAVWNLITDDQLN